MSVADRLEDGFPHGTREGYEQGCRGSRCPATEDGWLSCAQARTRYQSDYAYRKRVDAGLSPAQLAEADEREAAEQRAQLAAARARREGAPLPAVSSPTPVAVPTSDEPRVRKHGTYGGYNQGCRDEDACPSKVAGGISCVDARREYKRSQRERAGSSIGAVAKAVAEKQTVQQAPVVAIVREAAPLEQELIDARKQLAAEKEQRLDYGQQLAEAVKEVAGLELKLTDALARNAVLTDRVASLEMELDVAKAANTTAAAVELRHAEPVLIERSSTARFRFTRDDEGGVVVDVEGQEPGYVRFDVDGAGSLVGVSVQSGQ